MGYEIARREPPGPDLVAALKAAGIDTTVGWRPDGWVVLNGVDETDTAATAKAAAVLATYVPGDLPPDPPTWEERLAAVEARLAEVVPLTPPPPVELPKAIEDRFAALEAQISAMAPAEPVPLEAVPVDTSPAIKGG